MKKLVFVLIVLVCFFLIACNEKQDEEEQNNVDIGDGNLDDERDLNSNNQLIEENQEKNTEENNNDNYELVQYKEETKKYITACYESLDVDDYSEDNLNELKTIFDSLNNLIDEQNNKEDLYALRNKIICKIRSITPYPLTTDYILKSFDLLDEKEYWEETTDDVFSDNLLIVVLKKPINYIELSVDVFGLENATSLKYITGVTPPDYMFELEYAKQLNSYRQIVLIRLKPLGKEKLIEAIRLLEQIEFVKYVSPDLAFQPT